MIMEKINAFQNETDVCKEFEYWHSQRAAVTAGIVIGCFTIWVYHNGNLSAKSKETLEKTF